MNDSESRQAKAIAQLGVTHVTLPQRLTQGIVARRLDVGGSRLVASNLPFLRHHSQTGFDFGHESPGASDLALACVQAILVRLDISGPTQTLWDGSRVCRLALDLHVPFRRRFVETAAGDELNTPWHRAMGWTRQELLALTRRNNITAESIVTAWRQAAVGLPDELTGDSLDQADLLRDLRRQAMEIGGDAAILLQFLGMIA